MTVNKSDKYTYLDYASTTPLDGEVMKEIMKYSAPAFANPSSVHKYGQKARQAIDLARLRISRILNCDFSEIIFTSSATESNNTALKGIVFYYLHNTDIIPHIITTNIEHKSVLEPANDLKRFKVEVSHLEVDRDGLVNIDELKSLIRDNTVLVSIHYVNSEIGVIQPIKEIGKILQGINLRRSLNKLPTIYFHTDAVQAANYLTLDTKELMVDAMTLSSHKIYGPKGIALLYLKKGLLFEPIITGGPQEFKLRAGTENVSGICGLAKALEIVYKTREKESHRLIILRNYLLKLLQKKLPKFEVNGSLRARIANNLNISLLEAKTDEVLISLNEIGFAVSAGTACLSGQTEPSYVLKAISGNNKNKMGGGIRITLGRFTTKQDVEKFAKALYTVVLSLRNSRYYL